MKPISLRNAAIAIVLGLLFLGIFIFWQRADAMARTASGYKAKVACSEIFLAGRAVDDVIPDEFLNIDPFLDHINVRVDEKGQSVWASGPLWLGAARADYRQGYGCTLASGGLTAIGDPPAPISKSALDAAPPPPANSELERILQKAFAEDSAGHRAVVVMKDGALVAEHYADGFDANTPMLSWSAAKSIVATLIGAAAKQGLLDISEPVPVREWREDDARASITWRDMLHMQSGLAFEENYASPRSDVNRMLFSAKGAGGVAAAQPALHAPGAHWAYSSGTSNLLTRALAETLEENGTDIYTFAQQAVFAPVGAASFVMEPDPSGIPIGSSFMYATARDWALLGQLYLNGGAWSGEQLLPTDWSDFIRAPAKAADRYYGAHFWLNLEGAVDRPRSFSDLPESAYYMSGHEGQFVIIIPSADIVIVRLGMTRGRDSRAASAPLFNEIYNTVAAQ